jgi:uncharacterized protein (TIGR02611 family)
MKSLLRRWARFRGKLRDRPVADFIYRVVVAVVGLVVLLVGIVAIPYPGPGWAIVFLGLAILASEFHWAHRTLTVTREKYDVAMGWLRRQSWWVQASGAILTAGIVVATMWLLGAVGWIAGVFDLEHPALQSPIGFGS